jgi:hypothetical protein
MWAFSGLQGSFTGVPGTLIEDAPKVSKKEP